MTRKHNWQSELHALLMQKKSTPFQYGTWDCCLFACDCIEAMTGVDPAKTFRGRYDSRKGAVSAIKQCTGKTSVRSVAEAVTADHGMRPVPFTMAQRGDLALIKNGHHDYSLGIVALTGTEVVVVGEGGLQHVPITEAAQCWRV